MHNPQLQIMVHLQRAAEYDVSVAYAGVTLVQVTQVANPNYLFVDLAVAPQTKPGKFDLVLKRRTDNRKLPAVIELPYRLEPKPVSDDVAQGLDGSDVMYLLMPDRFANGDPANDSQPGMFQTGINRDKMYFRHGGDIQGIIKNLDYIEELGMTAIWPNPVLENDQPYESYHGYAITDHYAIDRRFGTNGLYKDFVDSCHRRGLKVVMDVILNHVGDKHYFISDLPEFDWVHQWDTMTRPNYREQAFLNPYANQADKALMLDGWFDAHMPDLNQRNPRLATYLIQNAIWWIACSGHDAYRIDTYIYPDQEFMAQYIAAIRSEYPRFLCFGEAWVQNVPSQAALLKNAPFGGMNSEMESLCDFQNHFAIIEALTKEQEWTGGVMKLYMTLSQDFLYREPERLVTFLDNHDLTRFYSTLGENPDKLRSAIAWLLTTRGIPQLYYGTELLMSGVNNPDGYVRQDFPGGWPADAVNKFHKSGRTASEQEMITYIGKLSRYRRTNTALQSGKTTMFIPENGVFVYFRHDRLKTVMVVMNTSARGQSVLLARFKEMTAGFKSATDIISGRNHDLTTLQLPAHTTFVLELKP
jgi:glycosidase